MNRVLGLSLAALLAIGVLVAIVASYALRHPGATASLGSLGGFFERDDLRLLEVRDFCVLRLAMGAFYLIARSMTKNRNSPREKPAG